MPRLSDAKTTKGRAASFLTRCYLEELGFLAELHELRRNYSELLAKFVVTQIEFFARCKEVLTTEEYQRVVHDFYELVAKGGNIPTLPADLASHLEGIRQMCSGLEPYFHGLEQLAFRWKLRASWAAVMLYVYDVRSLLKEMGMPDAIDVPLEQLDLLYPWPPPASPLEIKVSAWAFFVYGRKQIQGEIAKKLKDYEDRLKTLGLKEYPSSLEKHARWWFEHFVHGKNYDDIAQEEMYTPGGSLVSYARNVGDAVREFSRLVGIDARNLKTDR